MFRNNQLLRRSEEVAFTDPPVNARHVAVLVDPNEAEAGMLRAVLEKHEFHVLQAREETGALELAMRSSAQLVVASFDLPRVNGYQLFQRLREQPELSGIPLILITPQGEFPDKLVGHETYASDYIQRPVDFVEFENRLNTLLRVRELKPRSQSAVKPEAKELPSRRNHLYRGRREKIQEPAKLTPASTNGALRSPGRDQNEIESLLTEFHASAAEASLAPPAEKPEPVTAAHQVEAIPASKGPTPVLSSEPALSNSEMMAARLRTEFEAEMLNHAQQAPPEVPEEAVRLYAEACAFLLNVIRAAERHDPIEIEAGYKIAARSVVLFRRDIGLLSVALDRSTQFSLVQHSVNVAIISMWIARELGFSDERVTRLCLAGILHDIGSVKLPKKLLCKVGVYSPADRAEIERRPLYSAQLLSGIPGFDWLPQIVSQVYERENGTGYNGLSGKDIVEEAKVIGLADFFEACIHNRPHRRAMTGYQSLEFLTAQVDLFQERITKAMIRGLSVYPLNEFVELSTGEIAEVIGLNRENALRPVVKVIYSNDGERLDQSRVINLAENSSLWVTKAITADELMREGDFAHP